MDGATQMPISEFEARRWHNSRVCVWYFQVWKFQFCLLAKYFVSANNCGCSHINFGQTAVEGILILCCDLVFHVSSAKALDEFEYRMSLLPRLLSRDRHAGASLRERTWMNLILISFCTGLTVDGTTLRPWKCHKWLNANFRNVVGPCMDFSAHVPNRYLRVVIN